MMLFRRALWFSIALLLAAPAPGEPQYARAAMDWQNVEQLVSETRTATMTDPNIGLIKARNIIALMRKMPESAQQREYLATGLWLEAECLTRSNRISEARVTLDNAIQIAAGLKQVRNIHGNLALARARLAHKEGDVALSLKSYLTAYDVFRKTSDLKRQAMALEGLAIIYTDARDYPRVISYHTRAAEIYRDEPELQLSIDNNIGIALKEAGRYDESLVHFRRALALAKSLNSSFLQARILTNIAAVEAKLHKFSAAELSANQALALLGPSDANGWAPFVWGVKADLAFKRGALRLATQDIERAFRGVDISKTIAPFREIHEIAYRIYAANGNNSKALAHLVAFKRLDDEASSLAASANLALMSARFDFANQKLEIEHLKTEQIKREASLKESRAATQRVLLVALIVVSLLVIVWISWRHRILRKHRDIIRQANTELTYILGERNVEIARRVETETHLRVAMEAAEMANRAKTQFLANMSHELRTPLNAIIGFSELLATGMMPQSRVQEYSQDINFSGRKLLAILADILQTAQLDAGTVLLKEEAVVLGRVVELAVAKVAADSDIKNKDIRVTGNPSLRLRGDSERLVQIVEKLLSNAVKFGSAYGPVEIRIAKAEDGGTEIAICDDGVGIPPEQIEHIMDRFGQIESTYARSHGGIGLGLPIAKSLVVLHGGTLRITSAVDKGTTVIVHLPPERSLPLLTNNAGIVAA